MIRKGPISVKRWNLQPRRWPRGSSLRLALLSDPHTCAPWSPISFLERAVSLIQAESPDLILLLGDYDAHLPFSKPAPPQEVAAVLKRLEAPLGVYNVFGNHDWRGTDTHQARATLTTNWHDAFFEAGLETLENRSVALDIGPFHINLAGLGSQMAFAPKGAVHLDGVDDLDAALKNVDEDRFTILMAHEPYIFANLPDYVDLTVSGHTHGGQIRTFGRPLFVPSVNGTKFDYGLIEEKGRQLVISGGLGYSGAPLRVGVKPEITIVELGHSG